jgi:hypothetical protein
MRESDTQHEILLAWGAHPRLRIARINTGAAVIGRRLVRFNPLGTPDLVGLLSPTGRFVGIEVKSGTGKQRKEQQTMQRVIEAFGGLYVLARSVDDVDRAFATVGVTR